MPILEKVLQGPVLAEAESEGGVRPRAEQLAARTRDTEETSHAAPPTPELQSKAIQ